MWSRISLLFVRLLLFALFALIVVDAWVAYSQPMYYAESVLRVNDVGSADTGDCESCSTEENVFRSYSRWIARSSTTEQAATRLGYLLDEIQESMFSVTARQRRDTQLLSVRVKSTSPELSAQMANMLPTIFIDELEESQAEAFRDTLASMEKQQKELESQIVQTKSGIEPYLALGDEITEQESVALDQLQNALTQYENNYARLLHAYDTVRLAEAKSLNRVELVQAATIPTSPQQSIFFDLFNSVAHMQLDDRFGLN